MSFRNNFVHRLGRWGGSLKVDLDLASLRRLMLTGGLLDRLD